MTGIGPYAFSRCSSLTSITFPSGFAILGDGAFSECTSLSSVTIPSSVRGIGNAAFGGCTSLTNVTISPGVIYIGQGAFGGCRSLTSVTIPASVTGIGNSAFRDCTFLIRLVFMGNQPHLGRGVFQGIPGNAAVYYWADTNDWALTYGGLPTRVFPEIASVGSTALADGAPFVLTVSGSIGDTVVVETSENLITWLPFSTNVLDAASVAITDPQSPLFDRRFYRVRLP